MLRKWSLQGKSLLPWKLPKLSTGHPLPGLRMVQKPNGSWRPCGNYCPLNTQTVPVCYSLPNVADLTSRLNRCKIFTQTVPDCYSLPNVADYTSRLNRCKIFTKLDLTKGYYQVPMAPGDIPKTEVITPFGLFERVLMPFRLMNACFNFQCLMD